MYVINSAHQIRPSVGRRHREIEVISLPGKRNQKMALLAKGGRHREAAAACKMEGMGRRVMAPERRVFVPIRRLFRRSFLSILYGLLETEISIEFSPLLKLASPLELSHLDGPHYISCSLFLRGLRTWFAFQAT